MYRFNVATRYVSCCLRPSNGRRAVCCRGWPNVQRWLRTQQFYSECFLDASDSGVPWQLSDVIDDTSEQRIPFDLLDSSEAESVYRGHIQQLREQYRKSE